MSAGLFLKCRASRPTHRKKFQVKKEREEEKIVPFPLVNHPINVIFNFRVEGHHDFLSCPRIAQWRNQDGLVMKILSENILKPLPLSSNRRKVWPEGGNGSCAAYVPVSARSVMYKLVAWANEISGVVSLCDRRKKIKSIDESELDRKGVVVQLVKSLVVVLLE